MENGPGDIIHKVRTKVSLLMSIDWDGPMKLAAERQAEILGDILSSLDHVMEQLEIQGRKTQ